MLLKKKKSFFSFRTNVIGAQTSQIRSRLHQLQNSHTEKCAEAEIAPVKQTHQGRPLREQIRADM